MTGDPSKPEFSREQLNELWSIRYEEEYYCDIVERKEPINGQVENVVQAADDELGFYHAALCSEVPWDVMERLRERRNLRQGEQLRAIVAELMKRSPIERALVMAWFFPHCGEYRTSKSGDCNCFWATREREIAISETRLLGAIEPFLMGLGTEADVQAARLAVAKAPKQLSEDDDTQIGTPKQE